MAPQRLTLSSLEREEHDNGTPADTYLSTGRRNAVSFCFILEWYHVPYMITATTTRAHHLESAYGWLPAVVVVVQPVRATTSYARWPPLPGGMPRDLGAQATENLGTDRGLTEEDLLLMDVRARVHAVRRCGCAGLASRAQRLFPRTMRACMRACAAR